MNKSKMLVVCIFLLTFFGSSNAYAFSKNRDEVRILKVGVVDNYLPCSNSEKPGKKSGFAVDIWREIQEGLIDVSYEPVPIESFNQAILYASKGEVDLVVSCHTITKERLDLVEFSVPYARNSVGMISAINHRSYSGRVISLFSQENVLQSLLLLIGITGIVSILITVLEKSKLNINKREKVAQTLKTWSLLFIGEAHESIAQRRLIYVPLMLVSGCAQILLVTVLVAELTTSKILATKHTPLEDINTIDLKKMIYEGMAVVEGTETQRRLLNKVKDGGLYGKQLISKISFPSELPQMVQGMQDGNYKHMLASRSTLQYILANELNPLKFELSLVSNYSTPEAFVFGKNLPLKYRKIINQAISEMNYNGRALEILERYK